jgi:hypothetical protein
MSGKRVNQALDSRYGCAGCALVYTSTMTRLILAFLVLFLILPAVAVAQVTITVPAQQYKAQEKIPAKVENNGNGAVTFCAEVGQTSSKKEGGIESTPLPFWVQQNSSGKWGTLMIGPDLGSLRIAVVLEARETKEFPFRLNGTGRMRLRLNYWRGSIPNLDCNARPKGAKLVTSAMFTID